MSDLKQDRVAAQQKAQADANETLLTQWLVKHPELRDCTAVRNVFRDYMDFTDPLTEADFDFAYGNVGSQIGKQYVPTEAETKQALIEKICELIASKDGTGRDGKFSVHQLQTERTKMGFWNIQQLTARLDEVVRKQQMVKQPLSELHQVLQDSRQYQGYPKLPSQMVPAGKVRAVPVDAAYIRGLDVWELKRLNRLYGAEQVNARLRGE